MGQKRAAHGKAWYIKTISAKNQFQDKLLVFCACFFALAPIGLAANGPNPVIMRRNTLSF